MNVRVNGVNVLDVVVQPKTGKGAKKKTSRYTTVSLQAELRFAAQWAGYRWEDFLRLPGCGYWDKEGRGCQADILIMFRIHKKLEELAWAE
jgi:hypothetical protein